MRRNRVRPSIHHYNLLLRAIRDCGLGDANFAQELLEPKELLPSGRRSAISAAPADLAVSSGMANGTEDTGVTFTQDKFGDQVSELSVIVLHTIDHRRVKFPVFHTSSMLKLYIYSLSIRQ